MKKLIIAIDGPAGSGKSSIAKSLAKKINYDYLDTGAMYRCLTLAAIEKDLDVYNEDAINKLLVETKLDIRDSKFYVNDKDVTSLIRTPAVNDNVSIVCAYPNVRNGMADIQREIGKKGGYVLDGRDIGTFVFPNADIKIFQTADVEVRAKRRFLQLKDLGTPQSFEEVLENVKTRDKIDSSRALAPLKKADDAIELDTSNLTKEEVVDKIIEIIENKVGDAY